MTMLRCKKCKHVWNYKGISKHYTCCPMCKSSINVKNHFLPKTYTQWKSLNYSKLVVEFATAKEKEFEDFCKEKFEGN